MGIVETAPEEERFASGGGALDGCDRAFGSPDGVVVLLRQVPGVFPLGRIGVGRPGLEEVLPVGQAVFLHPDAVMLPGVGFVGVVARHLYVLKTVPRPVKLSPEFEITQGGLTFERGLFRTRGQRLKMGFTDKRGVVTVLVQQVANGWNIFAQFYADGPAAMPGRILAGDYR